MSNTFVICLKSLDMTSFFSSNEHILTCLIFSWLGADGYVTPPVAPLLKWRMRCPSGVGSEAAVDIALVLGVNNQGFLITRCRWCMAVELHGGSECTYGSGGLFVSMVYLGCSWSVLPPRAASSAAPLLLPSSAHSCSERLLTPSGSGAPSSPRSGASCMRVKMEKMRLRTINQFLVRMTKTKDSNESREPIVSSLPS